MRHAPAVRPDPGKTVSTDRSPIIVAAVDIGSNSAHMVVGRFLDQELHVLDRMREPICLGAGLDDSNRLTPKAQARAIACLGRFGQRLVDSRPGHVRAVGTNTLRRARNARDFVVLAEQTLGQRIEVIPGQEEARLIYLGVAHSTPVGDRPRLVIDIGGGSTEIILGEGFEVLRSYSLFMGCVTYTQQFFPGGELRRDRFRRAEIAAQLELRTIQPGLLEAGWKETIGASGTVHAVVEILRVNGWSDGGITLPGMKKMRKALVAAGHLDKLQLPGLKADRARVIAGGLAILIGIFKALEVESMRASSGALREGVLYDLVGRIRREDVRDRTIGNLVRRYHVDTGQAKRVESTALNLARQLGPAWVIDAELAQTYLSWAARLHEIGLAVSHTGYHKHGQYLVNHSDMPGFSKDDKLLVATLVRSQRRRLSKSLFDGLAKGQDKLAERLCVILRLATLLNRNRVLKGVPQVRGDAEARTLELTFQQDWFAGHPLTRADLEQEVSHLKPLRIRLDIKQAPVATPS